MVLVEVGRKAYLASIVPVIVNAILNEHQIVVDIVAFVNKGDFPRSRLGEKQRGKILATWVTRKMRTMAQFAIRDPNTNLGDLSEGIEPRGSGKNSLKNGSILGSRSSLRHVDPPQRIQSGNFAPIPQGVVEMPAQNYNNSIVESPRQENANGTSMKSDDTPTDNRKERFELPIQRFDEGPMMPVPNFDFDIPSNPFVESEDTTQLKVAPKSSNRPQSGYLPAVEGRTTGDLWSLPSQQRGGLRVHNVDEDEDEDDQWKSDAMMHMNLAGR